MGDQVLTTQKRQVKPRAPSRSRGILRYAVLVDATEMLLQASSPADIGLYQIAEIADVPPASVYHFFPTKDAAFLALAQRYLAGFDKLGEAPVAPAAVATWQALMAHDLRMAMNFYNDHPPASKLFLGGFGGEETRQAGRSYDKYAAIRMFRRYDGVFHMPHLPDPEKKFLIVLRMVDAIWAISYLSSGIVTEEYYEEALAACCAYCRLFLPEHMELRHEYADLIAGDTPVVIRGLAIEDEGGEENKGWLARPEHGLRVER